MKKINWKRMLKRVGLQTAVSVIIISAVWGGGIIEPAIFEGTRSTLSTSVDIHWTARKIEETAIWVKSFGVPIP